MSGGDRTGPEQLLEAARFALSRAAASTGVERASLLRDASRALFAAGDEAGARLAAREAFDAWPADDAAFVEALRDATADVDRLADVLAARARAVPAEAAACSRARADALLAFGRPEAALSAYRSCLADTPLDAEALAGVVEAETELGNGSAALAAARRLVEASAGDDARRAALDLAARVASRFADRGADAADLLEAAAAVQLRSGDDDATHALVERAVEALLRIGENARAGALMALAARTARGPRRAAWLIRLGSAAAARGDVAAARATREEALVADPTDARLRDEHLSDLEMAGEAVGLTRAIEVALGAPGADVPGLTLRLARACAAAGDDAGAERAYAALCDLGPAAAGWGDAARELSPRLEARGDLEGCARLELARAAAAGDPRARASALLAAAAFLERAGQLDAARAEAERARDADPSDAAPWNVLARLAVATHDAAGAANALLAAARLASGAPAASAALDAAQLLDDSGDPDAANEALRVAVAAVPGSPAARAALARRARATGDFASAAQHLASIDRSGLATEERQAHDRELARALSDAGDPAAQPAWQALFDRDEADPEAFDRLAEILRSRHETEQWLALTARHEGALSGRADTARRRDLRCERAALLTDLGHLDAAEGAWQAALALDPRSRRALRGIRALLELRGDHATAADTIATEALATDDPEEAAELLLDEARISLDKLGDGARAARAATAAVERLRDVAPRRARRLVAQAKRMGIAIGEAARPTPPSGAGTTGDSDAAIDDADRPGDVGDAELRTLADAATGASRASYLHRLSVRLERRGDTKGAADAALAALEADPSSAARFDRALALAGDERGRRLAAHRLRVRGAMAPISRAAALRELGSLLATSPESLPEAAEVLERAHALDPSSGAAAAALGRALLALGDPERTIAVMARFDAGAADLAPAEAARLLVEAAQSAGDPILAVEMARRVAEHAPRDLGVLATLSAALVAAGLEREAIAVEERSLALDPPGAERVERQASLASRAEAAGDAERALWLYEAVRAARPGDVSALAGLARLHAAAHDWFNLAAVAHELERAGAGDGLGPLAADAGRALLRKGDFEAALQYLRRAAADASDDPALLIDIAIAAERLGHAEEAERARAAARERASSRLPASASPQRAAGPPSIADALQRARAAPFDGAAAREAASLARLLASGGAGPKQRQLAVVARSAAALAAFSSGTTPRSAPPTRPVKITPDTRAAVAHPMARSAPARLMAALAPWLEPLFPSDLARVGVAAGHGLAQRAPELAALLDDVQRSLGTRSVVAFVGEADGMEAAAENTRPPSVVLGAGIVHATPTEQRFLLARALVLVDLGWAIAGKFAPRDVVMICELACRFAGATPPSPLLDGDRATPFLSALERTTPAATRDAVAPLAAEAALALAALAPSQLTAALRQTASRVALLHTGEPYAALKALVASERRLAAGAHGHVLADPDVVDLGAFALSDVYLEHRAEAEAP